MWGLSVVTAQTPPTGSWDAVKCKSPGRSEETQPLEDQPPERSLWGGGGGCREEASLIEVPRRGTLKPSPLGGVCEDYAKWPTCSQLPCAPSSPLPLSLLGLQATDPRPPGLTPGFPSQMNLSIFRATFHAAVAAKCGYLNLN